MVALNYNFLFQSECLPNAVSFTCLEHKIIQPEDIRATDNAGLNLREQEQSYSPKIHGTKDKLSQSASKSMRPCSIRSVDHTSKPAVRWRIPHFWQSRSTCHSSTFSVQYCAVNNLETNQSARICKFIPAFYLEACSFFFTRTQHEQNTRASDLYPGVGVDTKVLSN